MKVPRTHSFRDAKGRAADYGKLSQEIAVPQPIGRRRVVGEHIAGGLTPNGLADILQRANQGHIRAYLTLAEDMEERYLHYASQLQTRRLAIEGLEPTIENTKGVPTKIVDAVTELVNASEFDEMCGSLTDGIAKGFSVSEIMWDYSDGLLKPDHYIWRDPRFFQFDQATMTELRLADDSAPLDGLPLEPAKFVVHMPRSKMGLPIRRGMARAAAWAFVIQTFALQDWASFAEVYGVPLRLGRYHGQASEADKRTLLEAVRAIANDAAAIIPQGMEMEFHKVEGQHGAAVFGELIDAVDAMVSKLVVGQTMTSDNGSSMAQAKVHNEVRLDILGADGKQLGQTANRDVIRPFVDMNFGPQSVYPQVAFPVPEPEDLEGLTNAVSRLVPLGLRVSQNDMRERLGLAQPATDEPLLESPRQSASVQPAALDHAEKGQQGARPPAALSAAPHRQGCRCADCAIAALAAAPAPTDAVDEVEQLAAAATSEWEEITDPLLAPLRRILEEETSFEGVLKRLETESPDTRKLVASLARSTAIARGIGDVED